VEEGVKLLGTEGEGTHELNDHKIVGHGDCIIQDGDEIALVEVKAVQDKNFKILQKLGDWREKYGYYEPQAQCYLHFPDLYCEDEDSRGLSRAPTFGS
jgi:hypothetical protein